MKSFNIPEQYKSPIIGKIKEMRKLSDPRKKDFSPTLLDFGSLRIYIARHFGFCFGVENAVEISFRTVEENPGKRIFLLSQMIHNPDVNRDLEQMGIKFIMDTEGNQFIPWEEITADDIVIIPAFGTTIEIENLLKSKGIATEKYNTTCPFVERVWNRAEKLGSEKYTIIIHGKHNHEETRATFSHSKSESPSVIVKDLKEAQLIAEIIKGTRKEDEFYSLFEGRYSDGFNVKTDLQKVGVINQTTMLATETQEIAEYLKSVMIEKYSDKNLKDHYADTRDTLCYATNDNQQSTLELLKLDADLAIVIGGHNSSNTTHLVELLEQKFPTYFIRGAQDIHNAKRLESFNIHLKSTVVVDSYIPNKETVTVILSSGASCPDAVVEQVLNQLITQFTVTKSVEEVLTTI